MSILVSSLGVPRIGPRRELKTALESYWSGKSNADVLLETLPAFERRTGPVSVRSASPTSRPTISRSTTTCSTRASWSAPFPTSTAGMAVPRAGHLFRDGARHAAAKVARRAGARDDEMVRHQLPLHGAGVHARAAIHAVVEQAGKRIRRSDRARLSTPARPSRSRHLSPARQEQGRDARADRSDPGCFRSMSKCCGGSRKRARTGSRSTSPVSCSISTRRRRCARPTAIFAQRIPSCESC